ncbi:MAG: hypothetical protein U5K72_04345 [Balneolaceae bacterium]|nr:hypothetical protein [Balneolaceae bacterium]
MEKQFEYLINLAKEYEIYENDDKALFEALHNLSQDKLQSVFEDYGDPKLPYQPINMLRAEVAGMLLNGEQVTPTTVEEIKNKIRKKKREQLNYVPDNQLDKMDASTKETKPFWSWTRFWPLFYPFFYRDTVKETVRQYL